MPIASGVCTHYEDGITNGITEKWTITENTKLSILFQTETYQLTASIERNAQQRIMSFEYHVTEQLHGLYRINGQQLSAKRSLPPNIDLEDTLVWADDAILDLPFLSTKGHTILHLNQYGAVPVFAPHLYSGDRAGDLAKKSVNQLSEEFVTIDNKIYSAKKYRYGQLYWLDKHGIVLKVQADNYEMVLTEYTRFD